MLKFIILQYPLTLKNGLYFEKQREYGEKKNFEHITIVILNLQNKPSPFLQREKKAKCGTALT